LYQQITPFTNVTTLFIARQHAMHAERDSVMANPSVEPSSADGPILCLHEWTYHHTFLTVWWGHHSSFFEPQRRHKIPRGTPSVGTLNARDGRILQLSFFLISETVPDKPVVTADH